MNDGTIRIITAEHEIRTFIKNFSFYEEKGESDTVETGTRSDGTDDTDPEDILGTIDNRKT